MTAAVASIPITRIVVESSDSLRKQTTPLAKSLVLTNVDDATHLAYTNTMMRHLASLVPQRHLLGATDIQKAQVDSWLEYIRQNLEIAIVTNGLQADISLPMNRFDKHLYNRNHLVGESVTIADISLAVALYTTNVDLSNFENVCRLVDNVSQLSAFQSALNSWSEA